MRFGRLGIYWLSSLNGVTDDAGYADGAKHVQLVSVEKNFGLDGGWGGTGLAPGVPPCGKPVQCGQTRAPGRCLGTSDGRFPGLAMLAPLRKWIKKRRIRH